MTIKTLFESKSSDIMFGCGIFSIEVVSQLNAIEVIDLTTIVFYMKVR